MAVRVRAVCCLEVFFRQFIPGYIRKRNVKKWGKSCLKVQKKSLKGLKREMSLKFKIKLMHHAGIERP